MNTAQAVSICSNALILIGHGSISSFDEEGIGATVASSFYEPSYRSLLAGYVWNFATKKAVLSRLTEEPLNQWQYMYQLPTDHLRTITTYPHCDYDIVEDKIYSDNDKLDIDYIYRVDESFLPPMFRETFELYLAAKWAIPVTENSTNADLYLNMHIRQLKKAKSIDSLEKPNRGSIDAAAIPIRMRHRSGRRR